jgi:uncharacterized membrane protein
MDIVAIVLRILHIGLGILWAGSGLFLAWFLGPAVKAAGPDGGKVMGKLARSRWPMVISSASGLTVLSGIALYGLKWGGAASKTGPGIGFAIGGLFGLAAVIVGGAMVGRASSRMADLGEAIAKAGGPPKSDQMAEMQQLQARLDQGARILGILLVITILMMSIARYLPSPSL